MKKSQKPFDDRALVLLIMARDNVVVRQWPPSAHETYVRNRIPRGVEYDPADDGPEVDIINAHVVRAAFEFLEGIAPTTKQSLAWLNVKSTWPPDGSVDALRHRRE